MSETKINYKGLIFYGLLAAIIILVVIYFLPSSILPHNPVKNLVTLLSAKLGGLNFSNIKLPEIITKNSGVIAGVSVTAIPLGAAYIKSYLDKQKAKKELESAQELAAIQKAKTDAEITNYKTQISTLNSDTTEQELQKVLGEKTSYITSLEGKVKGLEAQKELLSKSSMNTLESLWSKSGGQVIEENGVKYKVIEKQILTVK